MFCLVLPGARFLLALALLAPACVPRDDLDAYSRGEASERGEHPAPADPLRPAEATRTEATPEPPEPDGEGEAAPLPALAPGGAGSLEPAAIDAELGRGDAGVPALDARAVTSGLAPPSDAAEACSGASLAGVCWYLGAAGASCNDTCREHGGYLEAATAFVGTLAQGGGPERCNAVLRALGEARDVRSVERTDGRGVGCHFFGTEDVPWWLSGPDFNPDSRLNRARLVCGCAR